MDKTYFSVFAMGEDNLGIVAAVTGVLSGQHGCNVETSQMAIVSGHFAITLIGSTTEALDCEALEGEIIAASKPTGVERVDVSELSGVGSTDGSGPTYSIDAEAPDRVGVLHEISAALAAREVNIAWLSSESVPGSTLGCRARLVVNLPSEMDLEELKRFMFDAVGKDIKLTYTRTRGYRS